MNLQPFCVRTKKNEAKRIQRSKIGKAQNDQRELVFGIAARDFGFVSDFGFRASDLDHKLFGCGVARCVHRVSAV
jgi:hypothetical protein